MTVIDQQRWQQSLLDWLILFLCPFSIAVDVVNGFFMLSGSSLPISVAFKAVLLILLIVRLAITDLRLAIGIFVLLLFYSLPAWRLFLLKGDFQLFFLDFSFALRVLFFLSFMAYVLVAQPSLQKVSFIAKVLALSLLVNLALGALGFGFPTYSADEGFGVKGFIFAGNELAITMVALSYFVLFCWVKDKPWPIKMVAVSVILVCGVLVATKSAMLGAIAIAGLFLLVHARSTLLTVIAILALIGAIYASEIWALIETAGLIDRFVFVYENRGLVSLIFSGRDDFFLANLDFTLSNFGLFGWIFGWGQGAYMGFVKSAIEIDLLDLYFYFGISGIVSYGLFFYLLYRLLNIHGDFKQLAPLTLGLLIFCIALFAGHVVYSGVAAIPLTLALYASATRNNTPPTKSTKQTT